MLQFTDYIRVYVVTCVLVNETVEIACKVISSDTIEDNGQVHDSDNYSQSSVKATFHLLEFKEFNML